MNENDGISKASVLGSIDSISKLLAFGIGLLYLSGFVIVANHLSRFGVSTFSILQLQYLLAGVWAFGPFILIAVVQDVQRRFERRVAPHHSAVLFNWRRFVISLVFSGIPFGLSIAILESLPGFWVGMTWKIFWVWFLFFLVIVNCADSSLRAWRIQPESETVWQNRDTAVFYLSAVFTVCLFYLFWFSAHIYPLIPFSWGGGKPLTVVFFENEKRLPEAIQAGSISSRSVPYELLAATDKYYVLIGKDPSELSMEISRDSVAGILVLKDRDKDQ
jgi:hypothetical protein